MAEDTPSLREMYNIMSARKQQRSAQRSPLEDLARIGQTMGAAYGGYDLPKFEEPEATDPMDVWRDVKLMNEVYASDPAVKAQEAEAEAQATARAVREMQEVYNREMGASPRPTQQYSPPVRQDVRESLLQTPDYLRRPGEAAQTPPISPYAQQEVQALAPKTRPTTAPIARLGGVGDTVLRRPAVSPQSQPPVQPYGYDAQGLFGVGPTSVTTKAKFDPDMMMRTEETTTKYDRQETPLEKTIALRAELEREGISKSLEKAMARAGSAEAGADSARLIGTAMYGISDQWAKAWWDKDIGSFTRAIVSDAYTYLGGKWGDEVAQGNAMAGLVVEVVSRLMPLLTKQGEKDGSVRLVESIFRKLEGTIPSSKKVGPWAARNQIRVSVENTLRAILAFEAAKNRPQFAEQIPSLRIDYDDPEKKLIMDETASNLEGQLSGIAGSIKFTPEQQYMVNQIVATATEKIDDIIYKLADGGDAQYQKYATQIQQDNDIDYLKQYEASLRGPLRGGYNPDEQMDEAERLRQEIFQ